MFDWITWGIWSIGFAIFIIWIVIPIREFKVMLKHRRDKHM